MVVMMKKKRVVEKFDFSCSFEVNFFFIFLIFFFQKTCSLLFVEELSACLF